MLDNAGLLLGELVRYNGEKEILHQNVEEEEDERADWYYDDVADYASIRPTTTNSLSALATACSGIVG
jgi:hypothetical protein